MVVSVFIGLGPRRDVQERDLWEEVDRLVPVRSIRMRGTCAFVDVDNLDDAHYVQRKLNGIFIGESRLSVQLSNRDSGADRTTDRRDDRRDERRPYERRPDNRRDDRRPDDRRPFDDRQPQAYPQSDRYAPRYDDRRDDRRSYDDRRPDERRRPDDYRRGDRRDRSPDRYDDRIDKRTRTEGSLDRREPSPSQFIPPPMTGGKSRSPSHSPVRQDQPAPAKSPARAPSH